MASSNQRIVDLDLFRYLAVTIAIAAHIVSHHAIYAGLASPEASSILNAVTRVGTPTLLILFGVMAELVYVRRFKADKLRTIGQLLYRAFLCYLAFLALALLEQLMVKFEPAKFVGAVILVTKSVSGNIFKLYAIYLAIMPLLLVVRQTKGILAAFMFGCVAWSVGHLLFQRLPELPFPLHHFGGLMLGIGNNWGPSILQGFLFISVGMVLGNALYAAERSPVAKYIGVAVIAASAIVLAWNIAAIGWFGVVIRIADAEQWRSNNHIGYYAYGVLATCFMMLLAAIAARVLNAKVSDRIAEIGGATLPYFFISNVVLLLTPSLEIKSPIFVFLTFVAYLSLFWILTMLWVKYGRNHEAIQNLNSQGPALISRILAKAWRSKGATAIT